MTHTGERPHEDRGVRNMKMLALNIGVMRPQAKEHWQPPDAVRGQNGYPQSLEGGEEGCPHLDFSPVIPILGFWPPEL